VQINATANYYTITNQPTSTYRQLETNYGNNFGNTQFICQQVLTQLTCPDFI
jgi:hypothetical protein